MGRPGEREGLRGEERGEAMMGYKLNILIKKIEANFMKSII